ncbi:MAG: metallophosphoesterase family protein [Flavobacteriaceae bacterium TMED206]|nr:MAG: metallophosphoesterase family protein [Flavobacteriaceae bacterium TMED206]
MAREIKSIEVLNFRINFLAYFFLIVTLSAQENFQNLKHWEIPSKNPDRIILTFHGDPTSSRAVTWRTSSEIENSVAQISEATVNANIEYKPKTYKASIEKLKLGQYKRNNAFSVNYHSVIFKDLKPNTLYAYRVGDGDKFWSEWIHFKTAKKEYSKTEFVFFGDSQNRLLSHWSRVIRMAYQTAPNASFAIHGGDLVDDAHRDYEWAEWFKAGSFIHSQWTAIPVLGNHEYWPLIAESEQQFTSIHWRPQFTLPVEDDLSKKLHETVYTVDYQDVRIIVLNSNFNLNTQTKYIEEKLKTSTAKWNIITCHHSIFSPALGRDFRYGRKNWKPLFDKYNVDLVLNGHDHTYARGHVPKIYEDDIESKEIKTVYVTSVSGPKFYRLDRQQIKEGYVDDGYKSDKISHLVQFFQVITIDKDKLTYVAYTATGVEYDRAVIIKDFESGEKKFYQKNEDPK